MHACMLSCAQLWEPVVVVRKVVLSSRRLPMPPASAAGGAGRRQQAVGDEGGGVAIRGEEQGEKVVGKWKEVGGLLSMPALASFASCCRSRWVGLMGRDGVGVRGQQALLTCSAGPDALCRRFKDTI